MNDFWKGWLSCVADVVNTNRENYRVSFLTLGRRLAKCEKLTVVRYAMAMRKVKA
ncbi:hypothetical protein [Neptunomonas sp.]|uniref:hypothetical protein n=1 Tax=Neptunomonas sp. TaxID=1971898 RepID=UPI0025D36ED7|nr:hypothetical protein [Neptunomonas sp.]